MNLEMVIVAYRATYQVNDINMVMAIVHHMRYDHAPLFHHDHSSHWATEMICNSPWCAKSGA